MHAACGGFARALPGAAGPAAHRRGKYIALGGRTTISAATASRPRQRRSPCRRRAPVDRFRAARNRESNSCSMARAASYPRQPRRAPGQSCSREAVAVQRRVASAGGAIPPPCAAWLRSLRASACCVSRRHIRLGRMPSAHRRSQHRAARLVDDDVIDTLLFCRQPVIFAVTLRHDKIACGKHIVALAAVRGG